MTEGSGMKRDKSIQKRMRKSWGSRACHSLCALLPLKKDKIVFTTFEGAGGYSCNPRYIAEEIIQRNLPYSLVWLVNDDTKVFPTAIKKVKNNFWGRIYHLSTAKVWIDNTRKPLGTKKRKGQIYLQTWHGMIGPKAVGLYRGDKFPEIAQFISAEDSRLIDYMLSNSDWCTQVRPKMLLYNGTILKTGSPRNDILCNHRNTLYQSLRERYQLPQDSKIILFAPTFRGGSQQGKREIFSALPSIDFFALLKALEEKFSGTWYLFLRMHPQLSAQLEKMPVDSLPKHCVDVSREDDMNELIAMSDGFITDYSSSAYDAMILKIPIFLYADDLSDYEKERGELMFDLRALPFPCAETHEELMVRISEFDQEKYEAAVEKSMKEFGIFEDGQATKRVVDLLKKEIHSTYRKK